MVVALIDEGYADRRTGQCAGRIQPAKTTAHDDDTRKSCRQKSPQVCVILAAASEFVVSLLDAENSRFPRSQMARLIV